MIKIRIVWRKFLELLLKFGIKMQYKLIVSSNVLLLVFTIHFAFPKYLLSLKRRYISHITASITATKRTEKNFSKMLYLLNDPIINPKAIINTAIIIVIMFFLFIYNDTPSEKF